MKHPMQMPAELITLLEGSPFWLDACAEAYAAGADAELDACCAAVVQLLIDAGVGGAWRIGADLRAARRPRPASLKEQALDALDRLSRWNGDHEAEAFIRRALEAFPDES